MLSPMTAHNQEWVIYKLADGHTSDGRFVYWHHYRRVADGKEACYCSLGGCNDPDLAEFLRSRVSPRTKPVRQRGFALFPLFLWLLIQTLAAIAALRTWLRRKPQG